MALVFFAFAVSTAWRCSVMVSYWASVPNPHPVASRLWLPVGRGGSMHLMEMGKCHRSVLSDVFQRADCKYWPAHCWGHQAETNERTGPWTSWEIQSAALKLTTQVFPQSRFHKVYFYLGAPGSYVLFSLRPVWSCEEKERKKSLQLQVQF